MSVLSKTRIWLYTVTASVVTTLLLAAIFVAATWNTLIIDRWKRKHKLRQRGALAAPEVAVADKNIIHVTVRRSVSAASESPFLGLDGKHQESDEGPGSADSGAAPGSGGNPFRDAMAAEDMQLVPDLAYYYRQYGIEIEEHEVTTDDGFVLFLWHFVGKGAATQRPPMLLLHGLLQSCGSFASSGRKSLAYYLHESGYDVWLGNNRCGLNAKTVPSQVDEHEKWGWDMKEMVKYDLKAMVEYVLQKTAREKLTLVAHSQGTTQGFMGLLHGETLYAGTSFRLADKLDNFVALAPAVYPGPLLYENVFMRFMASTIDVPWVYGVRSFLPIMMQVRALVVGNRLFSVVCYLFFSYLFDWNDLLWDKPLRDRHFMFSPVHISVNLMKWWLSKDPSRRSFRNYSHCIFPEEGAWFPLVDGNSDAHTLLDGQVRRNAPTEYPRILLFVPKQDRLVDGKRLIDHFINHEDERIYKIWYFDDYSHLDVLWASDVSDRIGKSMLEELRAPQGSSS
ncbi:AaceriAAL156Cp [[Ashbya] aceris (nom. inval.)]|nr:AaceriAAL156Cp [[Ashbya] aceris (nom. inval.)]